jgi:hypothetical protein
MNTNLIEHLVFDEAVRSLMHCLDSAMPGQIIFVIGLSGAGKSEVRKEAMRRFCGQPCGWRKGMISAVAVRATPSDQSYFSPKDFIARLNMELQAPHLDWLTPPGCKPDQRIRRLIHETDVARDCWRTVPSRCTEHQMRLNFERLARARGLRAIFVDEAGSMTYSKTSKHPGEHMVSYMCMAEEIPAILVMFGVPRVRALWEGNAEIRRRCQFVFVRRYQLDRPDDGPEFARVTRAIASRYAVDEECVAKNLDVIYLATAGVFGEVAGFFHRASLHRVANSLSTIADASLLASVYPKIELAALNSDARLFDDLMSPAQLR